MYDAPPGRGRGGFRNFFISFSYIEKLQSTKGVLRIRRQFNFFPRKKIKNSFGFRFGDLYTSDMPCILVEFIFAV